MSPKARVKSAKKTVRGRPFTRGDARAGVGKKGRSGRKPDEYRDLCAALLTSAAAKRSVARIMQDDRHPHFASIYKHLAEYAYGKPVQPVSGEGGGALLVRVVYEETEPGE